ncbi:MAG: DUF2141 domain-containing protein [Paludibacter sp.]|nr:DUF2141 domain-containing protein [Paludibacter sp.]MDD4198479.1 DUF2141 domain-containing protein [Paludibacter sp.]MDD4427984.1 DUF2141 domain-containing protein [Paludibacter sp.]
MHFFRYITALILLLLCYLTGFTQTIEVIVSNIRSNKGQLCVGLFESEEGFKKERPCWEKSYSKFQIEQEKVVLTICIPPGTYSLSVLDDENGDGKMNYNMIGVPREGFGFSGYEHKGIRKPQFKQFQFKVEGVEKVIIEVVMKYF